MWYDWVVYASACVLRSRMTCAEKLDYSEKKVRRFNLTLSSWADCAQRQDRGQDVWSQIRVQWMTITSFVPCYAPHVPQHGPLKQNYDFLRPICRNRLCISGLGISRQTGFNLEFPSPRWIACQGYELHPPFFRFCLETYKLLGEQSAKTMSFPCPASFV